jgi:hypothetical protein
VPADLDSRSKENDKQMNLDALLDDFGIRCFRDQADGDYICARTASRARLVSQFLWASQQAVEKYLKCILLLNRIPGKRVRHNLHAAIEAIAASGKLQLELTPATKETSNMSIVSAFSDI